MAKKFDNGRPGFLIFYEWMDALEEYSFEECGKFICAVGDYSRYGTIPDFEDKGLRSIWKMAKPTIDSNAASYEEKRRKTRYSSYVGVQKKAFQKKPENVGKEPVEGIDYLSYDDWYNEVDNINQIHADGSERQRMVANGSER